MYLDSNSVKQSIYNVCHVLHKKLGKVTLEIVKRSDFFCNLH